MRYEIFHDGAPHRVLTTIDDHTGGGPEAALSLFAARAQREGGAAPGEGYKARPVPPTRIEVPRADDPKADPRLSYLQRFLICRGYVVDEFYKSLEKLCPCPPMGDDMLARMNLGLGFVPGTKGRDYRPYCVSVGCDVMPRMVRVPEGFRCWHCGGVWDLRGEGGNDGGA